MAECDLFGRTVLMRHWERIGSRGRERIDEHTGKVEGTMAMGKLATVKRQRGYQDL
jgi:predicted DNA-binding WGR domain protein